MKKLLVVLLVFLVARDLGAGPLPRTILVLPFENQSTRSDLAWISESFAQVLAARLAGSDRIVLDRNDRAMAYQEMGAPLGTPLTLASVFKIAGSLGADWAVTGHFTVDGAVLEARAYLVDVQHFQRSGPFVVSGVLPELEDLQTRLAWRILALKERNFIVGSEEDFRRQFPVLRLDAHENYVRGILASDPESRVRFLAEASRRDPSDPRPAYELGRYYYEMKDYETSAQWLRKVPGGDAESFEARYMMGVNEFFLGRDAEAERAFTELSRWIPLNEVWNNLGFMQARRGRWHEAIVSFDRAYQGDPDDPDYSFNLGVCMWNEKKFAVAVRYLREALQSAPDDPDIHHLLREALGKAGDLAGKEMEDQWLEAREESSENGAGAAILPSPRLKKVFDRREYRARTVQTPSAVGAKLERAPAAGHGEAKP